MNGYLFRRWAAWRLLRASAWGFPLIVLGRSTERLSLPLIMPRRTLEPLRTAQEAFRILGETCAAITLIMEERDMHKDKTESARVRRLVRAKPRQCFRNAVRVVRYVPGYEKSDYVEGVTVSVNHTVTEHGWVERDGVIVDPTLPEDDLLYYPGLRFRGRQGISEAMRIPKPRDVEDLPILDRFGEGGCESPEFVEAWLAAYGPLGLDEMAAEYGHHEPMGDAEAAH